MRVSPQGAKHAPYNHVLCILGGVNYRHSDPSLIQSGLNFAKIWLATWGMSRHIMGFITVTWHFKFKRTEVNKESAILKSTYFVFIRQLRKLGKTPLRLHSNFKLEWVIKKNQFSISFKSENNLTWLKMMGESSPPRTKKFEILVNLDCFSKFLKYFKYFERQSKLIKNVDFFVRGERATLFHHFEPS